MLDNKFLEALTAVVEEGGFDKAAIKLNLTQSAISQRIRNLEEQLGQVLVVRSVPPEPTPAGRKLIKHMRQVRLMEQELTHDMGFNQSDEFITLPLGVNADSLATWLFDALEVFLHKNKVVLDLYVDDENQTHELLKRGEVVGCIGSERKTPRSCVSEHLTTFNYLCLCTPQFRDKWFQKGLTLESLSKIPAVVFNRKDETQSQMLKKIFPEENIIHPIFYVPSSEAFVDVVCRGLAYGMVPEFQVQEDLKSGRLIEIIPEGRVQMSLYWHCWNVETSLLNDLRLTFLEYFKQK
ncbi:LysR family transcriptional regulator ArgP [Maridesulfovibrio hydrothermalis]|uniref:Transcriptional regulator, LysR family n=1 Tax=Maridesulfovibrio hydrothermalis AM13 = DSM 14728 TaxID=1121451 RepID=L0RFF4_9BACT|nr:LysR family transcriptional regulator ArgP [Maridesulfovibrio hydrothermalis]CCO24915.1 Transcriptional regulator, LysR family [Maridesulfovibrio hydrothermalis AM13 = DSM 14728]